MESCPLNGFYSPAQRARFLAAVSVRASVRQFAGEPDVAQRSALNYAAARVCLPGVRIEMGENAPEKVFRRWPFVGGIAGTRRYAAIIADETLPRAQLLAGISGEAIRSRRIWQRNHSQSDRSHPGTRLCQCAAAYQSGEGKEDILRSDIRPYHQGADHDGRWKGYRLCADAPHHRRTHSGENQRHSRRRGRK